MVEVHPDLGLHVQRGELRGLLYQLEQEGHLFREVEADLVPLVEQAHLDLVEGEVHHDLVEGEVRHVQVEGVVHHDRVEGVVHDPVEEQEHPDLAGLEGLDHQEAVEVLGLEEEEC